MTRRIRFEIEVRPFEKTVGISRQLRKKVIKGRVDRLSNTKSTDGIGSDSDFTLIQGYPKGESERIEPTPEVIWTYKNHLFLVSLYQLGSALSHYLVHYCGQPRLGFRELQLRKKWGHGIRICILVKLVK